EDAAGSQFVGDVPAGDHADAAGHDDPQTPVGVVRREDPLSPEEPVRPGVLTDERPSGRPRVGQQPAAFAGTGMVEQSGTHTRPCGGPSSAGPYRVPGSFVM